MSAQSTDPVTASWLPITEFAVRTGISLSTVRRKIKGNAIEYRLERGRYLVLFDEANTRAARRPLYHTDTSELGKWHDEPLTQIQTRSRSQEANDTEYSDNAFESIREEKHVFADRAVKMVSEAFELSLHEKTKKIEQLERRNHTLETRLNEMQILVQVLEQKYGVRY